jgi:hypothetical protein
VLKFSEVEAEVEAEEARQGSPGSQGSPRPPKPLPAGFNVTINMSAADGGGSYRVRCQLGQAAALLPAASSARASSPRLRSLLPPAPVPSP